MSKPLLVYQAPVFTRSGYGDHARDILRSLFELDKYDVKIVPTRWGNTPQNQADQTTEFGQKMLSSVVTQLQTKPDIFVQIHQAYCIDASQYANKPWKHEDAFDHLTAIEMFKAYMGRYATPERLGRDVTAEDIARIHNGGLYGYKRSSTDAYWAKVKAKLIEFGEHKLANGKAIFEYEAQPLSAIY